MSLKIGGNILDQKLEKCYCYNQKLDVVAYIGHNFLKIAARRYLDILSVSYL